MKRVINSLVLAAVVTATGCATGPTLGVLSYYNIKDNKEQATRRAILKSEVTHTCKAIALNELNKGSTIPEINEKVGMPVVNESQLTYTAGETISTIFADVGDVIINGLVGYGGYEGVKALGTAGSSSKTYNINSQNTINGNDNQSNGSGGTSASTSSGRTDNHASSQRAK